MTDRITRLKAFLEEDPHDAFTRFALALEYRKSGDRARAARAFEDLLRDRPEYVGTYYHTAVLYREQGRIQDALSVIDRGVDVSERAGDHHAASELRSLKLEIELEEDEL